MPGPRRSPARKRPVGSTARTDVSRANTLARIAVAWDKRPSLSFGELLARSLAHSTLARVGEPAAFDRLEAFDDSYLAEAVERFVLLDIDYDPDSTNRP
jgi:hypothetical protein